MIWKQCKGFSKYEVSSNGDVRNAITGRILKTHSDTKGYIKVGLRDDNGKHSTLKVHRIVASTFLENPLDYPAVDHINRVRSDNRAENLRWVSNSTNTNNRICSVGIVEHIIELHKLGKTTEEIYKSLA